MDNIKSIEERLTNIEKMLSYTKNTLTFKDAIVYTGLSKSYLYKLTSSGLIPHYKPNGKQLFFKKTELDDWLLRNFAKSNKKLEDQAINYVVLNKEKKI